MTTPIPRSPAVYFKNNEIGSATKSADLNVLENEAEDWFTEIEKANKKRFIEEVNRKRFAHVFANHVNAKK